MDLYFTKITSSTWRKSWIIRIIISILIILNFLYILRTNSKLTQSGPTTTTVQIDSYKYPNTSSLSSVATLRTKLQEAEALWTQSIVKRHEMERLRPHILTEPWNGKTLLLIWDFFYATFNCPHMRERIGRVGDGGKWVCGLDYLIKKSTPCLVYSFGISKETSFDEEILVRSSCTLRGFDHTVNPTQVKFTSEHPGRSSFKKIGLGAENNFGILATLKSLMTSYGDSFIDILKVDIEGGELDVFSQIVNDFPKGQLPFGQLLIEVHLGYYRVGDRALFGVFKTWFEMLEANGLRAFSREANIVSLYFGSKHLDCFEFSFLNVGVQHSVIS